MITPFGSRIVVKPFEKKVEEKTAFGIIIPESGQEKIDIPQGEVIALGTKRDEKGKTIPFDMVVGDKVLFSKYGLEELTIKGEKYIVVADSNVICKLPEYI